ncbi:hypothetical protein [Gordonia sp. SND2]|uniref:hypothetical protein n=1 Tax=Gordonia sp. SND2 TaxID=3388659 RepID=UPI00398ACB88
MVRNVGGEPPAIEFEHSRTIDVVISMNDALETVRINLLFSAPDAAVKALHEIGMNSEEMLSKIADSIGARPVCNGDHAHVSPEAVRRLDDRSLPITRTEAGWPNCATCDGSGCPDCTDPS